MTNILKLLILFYCHMIQVSGVFKWSVVGKATDYGQNVTLFCHVPNCCPEDAGWDRWTPQQRTLFIDVKTGRPNKKYDGRIFKNGYTLIIQNLTKDDLNVSYSCLYGVTFGERKFLLEENVFTYTISASRFSDGEIAGTIVGVLLVVTIVVSLVYFWNHSQRVAEGRGSAQNEKSSNDPKARPKSELDYVTPLLSDEKGGSAASELTSNNPEVEAESKPDCVLSAEQKESDNNQETTNDHNENSRSKDAIEIPSEKRIMETIQAEEEIRKYVRIQVIGKNGVGKTSLIRRLLNQNIEGVTSTDGIDINRKCHIKESDGTWIFDNDETEIEKLGRRILHAVEQKQKGNQPEYDEQGLAEHNLSRTNDTKTLNPSEDQIKLAKGDANRDYPSNRLTDDGDADTLDTSERVRINDNDPVQNFTSTSDNNPDEQQLHVANTLNSNANKPITNAYMNYDSDQITEAIVNKMEDITLYIKNKQKTMTGEGLIECGIWDFAGQKEYYPTHQTFLTSHAIYLLVADITDDLKPINYEKQFDSDSSGDYIDFWLDSIHCYSKCIKNSKSETKLPPVIMADTCTDKAPDKEDENKDKLPPVIMVCTCMDKVPDKETKKGEFKVKFLEIFGCQEKGSHTKGQIHFISNVESLEDDFEKLRVHISKIANEMDCFGEKLPTRWIHLENILAVLQDLAEKGSISCCEKFENIEKLAQNISIEKDDLLLFLKYQHKIGNIIFFDDKRDYVILQPKWLVNCFRCLICDDDKNPCTTKELYDLRYKGMLTDQLIDTLFSKVPKLMFGNYKPHILDVMEKFEIVVKPTDIDFYYIPCMIARAFSLKDIKDKLNVKTHLFTPWLVLEFEFLPIAYYNHISYMYIKKKTVCKEKSPNGDGLPAIYAGTVVVYLDKTKQQKLVICFSRNAISLQIWNNIDIGDNTYRQILKDLCKSINELGKKLNHTLKYKIKSKCSTGDYLSSSGRISHEDIPAGGQYYCDEHDCKHDKEDIENTWFKSPNEDLLDARCIIEDAAKYSNTKLITAKKFGSSDLKKRLPRYPEYESMDERLNSFESWPSSKIPQREDLARAGFFYSGKGDKVKCFFCAGILSQWKELDVPIEEHKLYYPACPFIKNIGE